MHGRRQRLTSMSRRLFCVSEAERHDVLIPHERPTAFEVGHERGASPGGERQVHRSRLAIRLDLGLVKIHVAVKKQQTVTAAPAQGEQVPEQDAAVPAEHDRELAASEQGSARMIE
jgi:hypothetical protein